MFATGGPSLTASWSTMLSTMTIEYTDLWTNFERTSQRFDKMFEELDEAIERIWKGFVGYQKRVFDNPHFESRRIERYNWRSGEPERFRVSR